MQKVVAFDFDGTLVDTMPQLASLAADIFEGLFSIDRFKAFDKYWSTIGRPFEEQVEMTFNYVIAPAKLARAVKIFNEERLQIYKNVVVMPYANFVCEQLCRANIPLYIASSTPQYIWSNVSNYLPQVKFQTVKGSSKMERLARIKRFHHDAKVYFVGDAKYDQELAEKLDLEYINVLPNLLVVLKEVLDD